MLNITELNAQIWRAVVVMDDGTEALLVVGKSSNAVHAAYPKQLEELFKMLDENEKNSIQMVSLQRWSGAPDAGCWEHFSELKMPASLRQRNKVAASI
jgi:hypothetical protein